MCSVRWYNASAHYALYLAQSLKNSGMDVVIFGISGSPLITKAKEHGINVMDYAGLMNSGLFLFIKNLFKFRKILNINKFDIINPHMSRDHVFAFLSLIGKKYHIIRTRTDSTIPKANILNRIFYRISSGNYIVSSKYMVSHISQMGIAKNRISVIPLEINYKDFTLFRSGLDLKKKLKVAKDRIVVSFIGRLDRIKGVEYFLRSYAFLNNTNKFHYLVSGEEINLSVAELKRISDEMNISSISFLERMDDVRDLLCITDIGVIPSIGSESICRIGLEMLAFGIPVIGSNINSIPELLNELGGVVVNPGSPEEIADAIEYFGRSGNYKKAKKKILSKVSERQPDRFAMEYIDIISKVINK